MPDTTRNCRPGPSARKVIDVDGRVLEVPAGWELLPPGDAGLTRKVKGSGPSWTVSEKRGRKVFSRGVWAPAERIAAAQASVERQRADPAHQRKQAAAKRRRERDQAAYVIEFERHVRAFLQFDPRHEDLERRMARRIAEHATPVGSGTVARTQRIPVQERAEAATIAWMRHQTTAYDSMQIARIKGERREVRRALGRRSRELLSRYRDGTDAPTDCPLRRALAFIDERLEAAPPERPAPRPKPARSAARPKREQQPKKPAPTRAPVARATAPETPPETADDEAEARRLRQERVRARLRC